MKSGGNLKTLPKKIDINGGDVKRNVLKDSPSIIGETGRTEMVKLAPFSNSLLSRTSLEEGITEILEDELLRKESKGGSSSESSGGMVILREYDDENEEDEVLEIETPKTPARNRTEKGNSCSHTTSSSH